MFSHNTRVPRQWRAVAYLMPNAPLPDLAEPFDFGGVQVARNTGWTHSPELLTSLGRFDRRAVRLAPFVLTAQYDAEDPDDPPHNEALDAFSRVNTAMWLARPSPIAFRMTLLFEDANGAWTAQAVATNRHLVVHPDDAESVLSLADLATARDLFLKIRAVSVDSPVHPALGLLWRALRESSDWDIRYLTIWVAIEALFGPEDGREIGFRIAYRLARFLEPADRDKARELFRRATKGYDVRSSIVHGMRIKSMIDADADRYLFEAERWLRDSLRMILTDAQLRQHFEGHAREQYLDELVFRT